MDAPASANYGKYSRDGVGYEEAVRQNLKVKQDAELFYIKLQEEVKDKKTGLESKEGNIYEAWQASGISDARAFAFELFHYIKKTYPSFSFEGGKLNIKIKKLSDIVKNFANSVSSKKLVSAKEKKDIQKQLLTLITRENTDVTEIMSLVNGALSNFNPNPANGPQSVIDSINYVASVMAQAAQSISFRHLSFQFDWNRILKGSEVQSSAFLAKMSDFYKKHDDMVKIFQNNLGHIQTMLLTKIVPYIKVQANLIGSLNREILGFQQTIRTQGNEINGLRNEVEYIKQVMAVLSDENQQLNSKNEELIANCEELVKDYEDMYADYEKLIKTSESVENQMIAVQKKDEEYHKEFEQKFLQLQEDLKQRNAKINEKDLEIKQQNSEINEKDAAIKQMIENTQRQINTIKEELSETKKNLEAALKKQEAIKKGILQVYCQSGNIVYQNELCHRSMTGVPDPKFFPRKVLSKIANSLTNPFKGNHEEYINLRWSMYYVLPLEVREPKLPKEETLEDDREKDIDGNIVAKVKFGVKTLSSENPDDEKYKEYPYTTEEKTPLEYRYRVLTPEEEDAEQEAYNSKKLKELKVRKYPKISDEIAKKYDVAKLKNLINAAVKPYQFMININDNK